MNEMIKAKNHDDETVVSGLPVGYEASGSLAVALARAEVDQQIATARALPRSIQRAVSNIMTLATLDEESAEECVYALPRGGKPIKGPSVRLAEIIASQWGNCRVGARVVHVDRFEKYVEAEGVFHDLETNTATTARVRRRITDRSGKIYNDDMIVVTGNAACAIAKRNAILGAVPKAVWRKAYMAVESVIAGDIKTLAERRDLAMKAFAAFGVTPERIFEALGISGLDDLTLDHLTTLLGMRAALKSGESTVEEMFPVKKAAEGKGEKRTLGDKLDNLASGQGAEATQTSHNAETGEVTQTDPANKEDRDQTARDSIMQRRVDMTRDNIKNTDERGTSDSSASRQGEATQQPAGKDAGSPQSSQGEPASQKDAKPKGEKQEKAAPANKQANATVQTAAQDPGKREAYAADLIKEGDRRAALGMDELTEFLDNLDGDDAPLVNAHVLAWQKTAKNVDAKAKG